MKKISLSKTRLMQGLQCEKCLYLTIHHPELEPPIDASQQALFDQGHEVGRLAQKEFPGGVEITAPYYDTAGAVAETMGAVQNGATSIYEASFHADDVTVKVDILHRAGRESPWQIIEVKSSTSVKPEHIEDAAIQSHVLALAGAKVKQTSIMHINPDAVAPDLKNLFSLVDVTEEIESRKAALPDEISRLKKLLSLPAAPSKDIGPHCFEPYECPFMAHCWKHIPDGSIFEFPHLGAKKWDLYAQGIVSLNDQRVGPFVGAKAKQLHAIRTKERWVDVTMIADMMKGWKWPLLYLDFETIAYAIPRYYGTHPYEQVPFQFSAMIQSRIGASVQHIEYLHEAQSDPRPLLLEALVKVLQQGKSIVAYNKGFEAGRLKKLASVFPEHSSVLLDATERLVDPLPIFRGSVYDPNFKGSFSIKSVAPAILGDKASYSGMDVPDGGAAQRAFIELINPQTPSNRKKHLFASMREYCKKDTEVMVGLVDWLVRIRSKTPSEVNAA